jgi:phosphoribosylformylglycinamidine synthase
MQESDPRHPVPIADGATAALVRSRSALRYSEDVNGSFDRIAALHNEGGNVMGLMPHPEAFVRWSQHPEWTAQKYAKNLAGFGEGDAPGLTIFRNAAHYLDNN